jgi:hypothetical protein
MYLYRWRSKAVVKQKTPVAQVLDRSWFFYVDYEGGIVK